MAVCYRHPGRETNVQCSNCGRPDLPGLHDGDAGRDALSGVRARADQGDARSRLASTGAAPGDIRPDRDQRDRVPRRDRGCAAAPRLRPAAPFIATSRSSAPPSRTASGTGSSPPASCTPGSSTSLFNMVALYFLGSLLEPGIGTPRFLAVYFVSLLAGSFGALTDDPGYAHGRRVRSGLRPDVRGVHRCPAPGRRAARRADRLLHHHQHLLHDRRAAGSASAVTSAG